VDILVTEQSLSDLSGLDPVSWLGRSFGNARYPGYRERVSDYPAQAEMDRDTFLSGRRIPFISVASRAIRQDKKPINSEKIS